MKASETKLQKIIEGTNQYVVPLYQRPYSWEPKQLTALWEDLEELCEEEVPRNHFMGSIVTAHTHSVPEGVAKYLLIDGQQRMTTILLLLAIIRDQAKELDYQTLAPEIDETLLRNKFKQGNDTYKLLPTQADRDVFLAAIMGQKVDVGKGLLAEAHRFFTKKIRGKTGPELEKLKRVIVNNLLLVSILLEKDDNPHLIFESLNAKGLPLSQADLIRNYFFMKIHVDEQNCHYLKFWKPMQERLGDNLTECIRHFLMKDGGRVKQGEVYFALKERADEKSPNEVLDYLAEMAEFTSYYEKLLYPERENDLRIRNPMQRLNRLEVTVAYPFLLNVYRDFVKAQITAADFASVLSVLENFIIRRWICNVPTHGLNRIFPPLYTQSKQKACFLDGLKEVLATKTYPRDPEFTSRLTDAKLYFPGERTGKTKMLLERIEESYQHQEPVILEELTIEHVMPQTLTPWWESHLGENWEITHDLLLHTLGNLTLTGYNPSLSNLDFPQKRSILLESHLELNRHFDKLDTWNEDAIRLRGEKLAARALKIWPYFGENQEGMGQRKDLVTGKNPIAVLVLGQRFPTSSWRDVAEQTFEALLKLDSFDETIEQFPRFFGRDKSKFRSSRPLSNGIHFLTHLSAAEINRICIQVTQAAGLSQDDWRVEFAE